MELWAIVGGMTAGAFLGYGVAVSFPYTLGDLAPVLSLVGSAFGGASAFGFLWLMRQTQESDKPPAPPRVFRPQIVGSRCTTCEKEVIFIADGILCKFCNQVFCRSCEPNQPCSRCNVPVAQIVDDVIDWQSD